MRALSGRFSMDAEGILDTVETPLVMICELVYESAQKVHMYESPIE